jgi:diaminopimelate decarboxylase
MFWWEKKSHLDVAQNQLYFAGLQASALARDFGTPLIAYNGNRIIENFQRLKQAFEKFNDRAVRIHYAVKACSNLTILKLLHNENAWIDAVSVNEVRLALKAGFEKEKILFTGTSVSNAELKELVELGCMINIDSFSQLKRLAGFGFNGKCSIRWNPGEGAGSHDHTITAGKFIKFGIPEDKVDEAFSEARVAGLNVVALHQHIGSGWLGNDVKKFLETVEKTLAVAKKAEAILGKQLEFVDFGGGPGIRYKREQQDFPIETYAKGICDSVKKSGLKAEIAIEPGRYIVGDAAILLAEINTVEEKNVPVIGVNAGFNCLIRPAFYGAHHEMIVCENVGGISKKKFLIAGNLCESSDVFNENKQELRELPIPKEGNTLAILNAGAYGFAMASNYNLRSRPAEVLVLNKHARVITDRESFEDLIKKQKE